MLLRSPYASLFRKITDIERLIQSGAVTGASPAAAATPVYVDEEDAKWDRSAAVAVDPADIGTLSPMQFALYRYGVFVTRLLSARCGGPKISLLLAHDLPPSPHRPNAFRNSYRYEPESRVLFVRTARLRHVGDLALIVTHAVAHVKCGDLDNDRNPSFVHEFYLCLRAICQDLFMTRARHDQGGAPASAPAAGVAAAAAAAAHPLHAQFAKAGVEERIGLVNAAVDLAVPAPLGPAAMHTKYGGLLSVAELQATATAAVAAASPARATAAPPSGSTPATAQDDQLLDLVATARQEIDVDTPAAARQALAERRKMLEANLELSKSKPE